MKALRLSGTAHDFHFLHDILLDFLTADRRVLLRVKGLWILCHVLLDTVGEGNTQIGRIIDFADTALYTLAHGVIRDTRGAMKNKRNGDKFLDLSQPVEVQLRDTLVNTVSCTNADRQ